MQTMQTQSHANMGGRVTLSFRVEDIIDSEDDMTISADHGILST